MLDQPVGEPADTVVEQAREALSRWLPNAGSRDGVSARMERDAFEQAIVSREQERVFQELRDLNDALIARRDALPMSDAHAARAAYETAARMTRAALKQIAEGAPQGSNESHARSSAADAGENPVPGGRTVEEPRCGECNCPCRCANCGCRDTDEVPARCIDCACWPVPVDPESVSNAPLLCALPFYPLVGHEIDREHPTPCGRPESDPVHQPFFSDGSPLHAFVPSNAPLEEKR